MEAFQHLVAIGIATSLAVMVISVGLDATVQDVTSVLRRPAHLLKAVVAVNLVTPLAAAVLIAIFPLGPASKLGLMLMAVSPVPPFVTTKEIKVGARRSYAYGLYAALVVLAVAIVPAMIEILSRIYGVDVSISPQRVAENVVLTALAPLAIGMLIRWRFPLLAERIAPLLGKIAMLLAVLVVLPLVVLLAPRMYALVGDGTVASAILMVAAALFAGHLLGGPDRQDRAALAVTAATRHPGIALLIAKANAADKQVSLAIILVLLAGLVAVMPYQVWLKRSSRGVA